MRRRAGRAALLAVIAAALCTGCGRPAGEGGAAPSSAPAAASAEPEPIALTSPAFGDGGTIPEEYSCLPVEGPPRVEWRGVPAGAAELVLVMDDVTGGGQLHWTVAGIDPTATGWPAEPSGNAVEVKEYFGPCPRTRSEYRFRVFALDEPSGLAAGDPERPAVEHVETAAAATGQLIGFYP